MTRQIRALCRLLIGSAAVVSLELLPGHAIAMGMGAPPKGMVIGRPDLTAYCQENHWDKAVLIGSSAGSWRCSKYIGLPLSMQLNTTVRQVNVGVTTGQVNVGYQFFGDISLDQACEFTFQSTQVIGWIGSWWKSDSIVCVRA